jgi:hypothetical protein
MDSLAVGQLREKIRQETRHLVHYSQERIKQGKHSILVRKGDFIYTYQLFWFISRNFKEFEFPIHSNNDLATTPLGPQFYEKFQQYVNRSVNSLASRKVEGVKCYELYTIHLGIVRNDVVAKNNRELRKVLQENINN